MVFWGLGDRWVDKPIGHYPMALIFFDKLEEDGARGRI
jgi:hypothetical protein